MIELILLWLLMGSISMNIAWIELDKETLEDFDLWKERKNSTKEDDYIKGFVFGLIFGPLARKIGNEKRSRNSREDQ